MYRAFQISSAGGYAGWFEISADNDAAALDLARRQARRMPMDVWCGGRFVGRIEHADVDAGAAPADPRRASDAA